MESVSSIPTLFLVAAGIFVVSVALLVLVLWLGRRWLIGPLRQLSHEVEQLKEAERQPSLPALTVIAPQEIIAPEVVGNGLEPMQIGLSDTQDSGSSMMPGDHSEDGGREHRDGKEHRGGREHRDGKEHRGGREHWAGKEAILSSSEETRIMERSDSPPAATIANLAPNDIYEMCCLIHDQIKMSIGEISLMAVLYDMRAERIEIAYPAEEKERASSPAEDKRLLSVTPLLWSVVRTGQALQETTQPGGSWLGVPMRTGDEVLGALVIQNTQLATGFDETDQHLLSNLAAQVAIVLRCRRQAASTRIQAERGQLLASLTRKIWTYSDRDAILRTALEETGRYLHASSGLIQLEYSDDEFIG